jgi:hypothetical protein
MRKFADAPAGRNRRKAASHGNSNVVDDLIAGGLDWIESPILSLRNVKFLSLKGYSDG